MVRDPDPEIPKRPPTIIHVVCPQCDSHKAVVAATYFGEFHCFCPKCQHVWDCDAEVLRKQPPP